MDEKDFIETFKKKWVRPPKKDNRGNIEGLAKYIAHRVGGDPHLWTKCMAFEKLQGYDHEARAAICARVHKIVTGYWTREKKPEGWSPDDNKYQYDPTKKEFEDGFIKAWKGGRGSGNHGHGGLPGVHGGSSPTKEPKVILGAEIKPVNRKYRISDEIRVDFEKYFADNPTGGILYEIGSNWMDWKYLLISRNPSKREPRGGGEYESDFRATVLSSSGVPRGHRSPYVKAGESIGWDEFIEDYKKIVITRIVDLSGKPPKLLGEVSSKSVKEVLSIAYKGGKGSGNWGHSGLAGVHGGSSPTISATNLDRVSRFIDVEPATRGRKKEIQQAVFRGLDLIDGVHKANPRGRFPIKIINSSTSSSARIIRYASNNRTARIEVNQRATDLSEENPADFLHEMGHYFTITSDGSPEKTPESEARMKELIDILSKTEHVKSLKDMYENPNDYERNEDFGNSWVGEMQLRKHIRYLLNTEELLARSYAQYVLTKSKQKKALDSLKEQAKVDQRYGATYTKTPSGIIEITLPMQWTSEDFKPAVEAWDNYFRSVGWLNE